MSSSNPFRQARITQEDIIPSSSVDGSSLFEVQTVPQDEISSKQKKTKPKKKVVIKTPPRSPEETHRRLSIGRPPSPPPLTPGIAKLRFSDDVADTDSVGTADSDLEQAVINTRKNSGGAEPLPFPVIPSSNAEVKAPYNPFARTLATSEQQYGVQRKQDDAVREESGQPTADKPAFDVDMFKNILLNGAQPPVVAQKKDRQTEKDSQNERSLDNSDEQSFEMRYPDLSSKTASQAPVEIAEESSSDEYVEEENDEADLGTPIQSTNTLPSASNIPKGPQTVSFEDIDDNFSSSFIPQPTSSSTDPVITTDDSTDAERANKPLPATPSNESVVSPNDSAVRKTPSSSLPPPPPNSRRTPNSQGRPRSGSAVSRSSMQSDTSSFSQTQNDFSGTGKAPPPPPSRRSLPTKTGDGTDLASPPSDKSMPPPPAPRRAPSMKLETRSSSSTSRSSLQRMADTPSASSPAPPRPPPRRVGGSNRSSVDGASLARRNAEQDRPNGETSETPLTEENISKADLLSDLAALQKEVDELRARAAAG